MLAKTYYLPPFTSRGMTRDYLLKVHRDQVFRAKSLDLRYFEVELTPEMNRRVGLLNNCFLVRKVNVLLNSRGQVALGFDEYDPPEESWLYRVVRYIDPTNILSSSSSCQTRATFHSRKKQHDPGSPPRQNHC